MEYTEVIPHSTGTTLIIVPVLYLFSERELASNGVVWATMSQLYRYMLSNKGLESILGRDEISQTLFYFPFGDTSDTMYLKYMTYLSQRGFTPLHGVKTEDQIHSWLRIRSNVMRVCELFRLSPQDFAQLPMNDPVKMAAAFSLRLGGVPINEIACICNLSYSEAQVAILLADMNRSDLDFQRKLKCLLGLDLRT